MQNMAKHEVENILFPSFPFICPILITMKTARQIIFNFSLVMRKPVFGVSDPVRLKPACAATETR